MNSIVLELQKMAMENISAVQLLRKAKVVAVKLDLVDMLNWIENELDGYSEKKKKLLPNYRKVSGNLKAWNHYRNGWQPLLINDGKFNDALSSQYIQQSIGELQDLLNKSNEGLMIEFSAKQRKVIAKGTGENTRYALFISPSAVANILESVQNKILDWSLELEKAGILGQGFTSNSGLEKRKVHSLVYVSEERLDTFKKVTSKDFDLTKLIKMCEELTKNYKTGCYYSCAMLLRAIVDHVPPIFEQKSFDGVVNNYKGSKSFKKSMSNLQNSLRNISDSHLHEQIRNKEILPNNVQIDFSSDLDVLLGEICRILK